MITENNTDTNPEFKNNTEIVEESQFLENNNLTHVVLPKSIKVIDYAAFAKCKNLSSISLPNSLKTIKTAAFFGCDKLQVVLPDSVEQIETQAFFGCESQQSFFAPKNLKLLGSRAFMHCSGLKRLAINPKLKIIGSSCFAECENLQYAFLDGTLKKLENGAFSGCKNLRFASLKNNQTSIKPHTFYDCEKLEKVVLPGNLKSIDNSAFFNCMNLKEITVPKTVKYIESDAFRWCYSLKKVEFLGPIEEILNSAFEGCLKLNSVTIPNSCKKMFEDSFPKHLKVLYLNKDGSNFTLCKTPNPELEQTHYKVMLENGNIGAFLNKNFRENFVKLNNLKAKQQLKFFPSQNTLKLFPSPSIENFFTNKNYLRFHNICKQFQETNPNTDLDQKTFESLFNVFYCLGGFSNKRAESEKAYKFVCEQILKHSNQPSFALKKSLQTQFSKFEPATNYCPEFAKFFMKYYESNPNFMQFCFNGENGFPEKTFNYLAWAQKAFPAILKYFPNKELNGTGKNNVLTPEFVAKHSKCVEYKNVNENNEQFASFISCFGYSQNAFETMQNIYDKAKLQTSVLKLDTKPLDLAINFRLLAKDDPLGFVLGDVTNCCQKIGDNAESCIEDGYLSEFAGFVVFENNSNSKKSNSLANILGQSYVWYDPNTKTVCLDNIEIPRKVKEDLENSKNFNEFDFMESIEKCAESFANAMNKNGTEVLQVTIGDKHNDLKQFLESKFELESPPKALNNRFVFSDAERGQFVLFKQNSPSKTKNTFNLEN